MVRIEIERKIKIRLEIDLWVKIRRWVNIDCLRLILLWIISINDAFYFYFWKHKHQHIYEHKHKHINKHIQFLSIIKL